MRRASRFDLRTYLTGTNVIGLFPDIAAPWPLLEWRKVVRGLKKACQAAVRKVMEYRSIVTGAIECSQSSRTSPASI